MRMIFTCDQGHQWPLEFDLSTPQKAVPLCCPKCTARPVGVRPAKSAPVGNGLDLPVTASLQRPEVRPTSAAPGPGADGGLFKMEPKELASIPAQFILDAMAVTPS